VRPFRETVTLTVTGICARLEEMAEVASRCGGLDCRDFGAIVRRRQPRFVAYAQTSRTFGGMLVMQLRVRPTDRVRVRAARRGRGDTPIVAWHSRPSLLTNTPNKTLSRRRNSTYAGNGRKPLAGGVTFLNHSNYHRPTGLAEQTRILTSGARRTGHFGVFLAGPFYHDEWLAPASRVGHHGSNQMEVRA